MLESETLLEKAAENTHRGYEFFNYLIHPRLHKPLLISFIACIGHTMTTNDLPGNTTTPQETAMQHEADAQEGAFEDPQGEFNDDVLECLGAHRFMEEERLKKFRQFTSSKIGCKAMPYPERTFNSNTTIYLFS